MAEILVVGGGAAGLTAAFKIRQAGHHVRVLEARDAAGGNVRTVESEGFRMETGPHGFMGSSEHVRRLARELGIESAIERAGSGARRRYIYRDGRLHPLPVDPVSFLRTSLLSARGKLRLCMEPFIAGRAAEMETAWRFFCRRFGVEAATYIISPFVSGIYAGDVERLGARAAFAKFWQFERDAGSMILGALRHMLAKRKRLAREGFKPCCGLFSFRSGLGGLTATLARSLEGSVETHMQVETIRFAGGRIRVRAEGQELAADAVVLAVPPPSAADILDGGLPMAAEDLRKIPMAPVALVHWACASEASPFPSGFGFLVPRLYGLRILGTIFTSQLFAGRAPAGSLLLSSFFGGMLDPERAAAPDGELERLVRCEHALILGRPAVQPRILQVMRYPGAIPQLLPDHPERIARVRREGRRIPGLSFAGNYLIGVSLEHAVETGYLAARECLRHVRPGSGVVEP